MEAPLPSPIEETAAASTGDRLYVMGGFDAAGRSLSGVFVFDGTRWFNGPRLPLPLDHASAATLDDHVYIAGGHSFGRDSARVFRLDGNAWTEVAPMRFARGGHALIAAMGRLYVIGGNNASSNVFATEVYDPAANAWSLLPGLPVPRNHVAGFVLGTSVCVAGGRSPDTSRVDCLDTVQHVWSRLPDLPKRTSGAGAANYPDGSVVVLGGQNATESAMVSQLTRYAAGGSWTTGGQMLVTRHGFELAIFGGRAWACGGATLPGLHPVSTCTSIGP